MLLSVFLLNSCKSQDYIGFISSTNQYASIKYGMLYNGFVATDSRNLASDGWHVPSNTELTTLQQTLGGALVAGSHLKEVGFTYWTSANTDADNSSGFTGRGSGGITALGVFSALNSRMNIFTTTPLSTNLSYWILYDDRTEFQLSGGIPRRAASSITLICDSTIDPGFYVGNDGKRYPTRKVGDQVILGLPLAETKYRNGEDILLITNTSDWAANTTLPAMAYPDFDPTKL